LNKSREKDSRSENKQSGESNDPCGEAQENQRTERKKGGGGVRTKPLKNRRGEKPTERPINSRSSDACKPSFRDPATIEWREDSGRGKKKHKPSQDGQQPKQEAPPPHPPRCESHPENYCKKGGIRQTQWGRNNNHKGKTPGLSQEHYWWYNQRWGKKESPSEQRTLDQNLQEQRGENHFV